MYKIDSDDESRWQNVLGTFQGKVPEERQRLSSSSN
jgi:hypothetical protein